MTLPLRAYRILRGSVHGLGWCLAQMEMAAPPGLSLPWKAWRLPDRFGLRKRNPAAETMPKPGPFVLGNQGNKQKVWVHAASLGEAAGVLQMVRHLPLKSPCLLTAQTQSGYDRLHRFARDWNADPLHAGAPISVAIAPFDSPDLVRRFLREHAIAKLILYESECWPGLLEAASGQDIPIFWLAARWGRGSHRLGSIFPNTVRRILQPIRHVQARSELDARRIRRFYTGPVTVGCDVKGLGMPAASLPGDRKLVALYCVHRSEWPSLRPHIQRWMDQAPLVVLPRYPKEFAFFREELKPLGFVCHSETDFSEASPSHSHVLVDALGCGSAYLQHAQIAFVGGTLNGKGGHAFWEPLRLGLRLVTGPSVHNQDPWIDALQGTGLLRVLARDNASEWSVAMRLATEAELALQALRISVFLEELNASQTEALREMRAIFHAS
jgi:3-deoxy-D-manno-octulosonic-acid transferase